MQCPVCPIQQVSMKFEGESCLNQVLGWQVKVVQLVDVPKTKRKMKSFLKLSKKNCSPQEKFLPVWLALVKIKEADDAGHLLVTTVLKLEKERLFLIKSTCHNVV